MHNDGSVVAVMHDLPGRPCMHLDPTTTHRSTQSFSCLMSVGKLKREIVKEFTRRTLAVASGDTPSTLLHRGALTSAPHTGLMGSSHSALFSSPLGFPVLGERFLVVQVNNRTVPDGTVVGDALRDRRYVLPGTQSVRVFAAEFQATVRFQWDASHSGHGGVHSPLGPEQSLGCVSGSTLLSELRRALVASWSRAGRRPMSDVGWGFVFVAPRGIMPGGGGGVWASSSSHEIVDFILSDALVEHWDINALRASLPLVERLDPVTGVVVITLFLHAYPLVEVAAGHHVAAVRGASPPSGVHTWPHAEGHIDSDPEDFVTARVRVTTRCVSPRLAPKLVEYYSVHEVSAADASPRQRSSSPLATTNRTTMAGHRIIWQ